jgi:hypothetical protein
VPSAAKHPPRLKGGCGEDEDPLRELFLLEDDICGLGRWIDQLARERDVLSDGVAVLYEDVKDAARRVAEFRAMVQRMRDENASIVDASRQVIDGAHTALRGCRKPRD